MIPCQRPVPISENEPRVPLDVPNETGQVESPAGQALVRLVRLTVPSGGLKLWYLYGLLISKRRLARNRSRNAHSFAIEVCIQITPGASKTLRPSVPAVKA